MGLARIRCLLLPPQEMAGFPHYIFFDLPFGQSPGCPEREDCRRDRLPAVVVGSAKLDIGAFRFAIVLCGYQPEVHRVSPCQKPRWRSEGPTGAGASQRLRSGDDTGLLLQDDHKWRSSQGAMLNHQ